MCHVRFFLFAFFVLWGQTLSSQRMLECAQGNLIAEVKHPSCYDMNDGRVAINDNVHKYYLFQLLGIKPDGSEVVIQQFTPRRSFEYLRAGQYRLVLRDTNQFQCFVPLALNQPEELKIMEDRISAQKPNSGRANGSIDLSYGGGESPYTIHLHNNNRSFKREFPNERGGNKIISGLKADIYNIRLTDAQKCESKEIQFALNEMDNFGFNYSEIKRACNESDALLIRISDGQPPYRIETRINDNPLGVESYAASEITINLNRSGSVYEFKISDARNIARTFAYQYSAKTCQLQGETEVVSRPSLDAPTGGIIRLSVTDGEAPFVFELKNTQTEVVLKKTSNRGADQFGNLGDGVYVAQVTDSRGRIYDSRPIRLDYVLPSAEEIRREFERERERDLLDLRKCQCHRARLISTQKILRIGIGVLGLAGTIASAGAGSLVGGIISGGVSTGGMFVNEFANEKEIEKLGKDFVRLKEVEALYRSMPDRQFDPNVWNRQRLEEYQTLKNQIAAERAKLSKDFAPRCKDKKLKKYGAS